MAWEILAIWLIVGTTIVMFVRDERRLQLERLTERARRYATAPAWQHREPARGAPPPRQQCMPFRPMADLTALQRQFAASVRRAPR